MRGAMFLKTSTLIALSISLAGCTTLPRSGPSHQAIDKDASVRLVAKNKKASVDYALVDITKHVASKFDYTIINSLEKGFGATRSPPPETPLGVGDIIEITIFEAQAGGLFIPSDAGSRPGNYITLPKQTVDRSGSISVPYAGTIKVAGRSVGDVQTEIEGRLSNRAIEPQVVISTTLSRSNMISVLGDVNTPAQLNLSPGGERVLDVIARAGGLSATQYETYVNVQRRGREATVLFRSIIDRPAENIYVYPGDTVYVNRERRTYLVFGATEQAGRIDFDDFEPYSWRSDSQKRRLGG